MALKKNETLGFKAISKEIKLEIRDIKDVDDEHERLERFKALNTALETVLAGKNISKAVAKPNKDEDGFVAYLTPTFIGAAFSAVALPALYSAPLLSPYFLLLLPPVGAAAVVAGIIGRRLLDRDRAKDIGVKTADVKYARKIQRQYKKVFRYTNALDVDKETDDNLKQLKDSFQASADASAKRTTAKSLAAMMHKKPAAAKKQNTGP